MQQLSGILAFLALFVCFVGFSQRANCQTEGGLTARTLYYNSGSDVESKPQTKSLKKTAAHPTPTTTSFSETPAAPSPLASHLGLRYNLLQVNPENGAEQPVDSSTLFHANDCLALNVQSNYDGFLYVLYHGSSGKWDVLLPSQEMTDESNRVAARTTVKAPSGYCFTIENPPGVEHLFVVLARNPQDISELNSAVKASRTGAPGQPGSGTESPSAPPKIGVQMARLEQNMRSRDLRITKIGKSTAAGEPENAVYVVDTTGSASDRLVAEIQIRHN